MTQWLCLIGLDVGFFCYLLYFLPPKTALVVPDEITSDNLNDIWTRFSQLRFDPLHSVECKISFFFAKKNRLFNTFIYKKEILS